MRNVEVERIVEAPIEEVFRRYTDHAAWSSWAGLGKVTRERDGAPSKNGVGCIRVFNNGLKMREEIVSFDEPTRMTYRIVGFSPLRGHLGEVTFEPHETGTRVVWRCQFDSRIPFTGAAIERALVKLFTVTLSRFARHGLAAS